MISSAALEKQIDEMVYKLHGLTPEAIAVVRGSVDQLSGKDKQQERT